ncbi:hypothetical protein LCGC14_2523650 [marine sediment metagenome]|uniref:Uncharacterized protein n=1 Tax=marine sediment metagenome TaxID=412755 RepID=A0A0F9AVM6_9ZZZZ
MENPGLLSEERATGPALAPDAAVAKAQAIYTPLSLRFYDLVVHGLSNRFAWRCPTQALVRLYEDTLSANHLEAGVGTGLLIDRAGKAVFDRLVLLDINRNCLASSNAKLVAAEERSTPALDSSKLLNAGDMAENPPLTCCPSVGFPNCCAVPAVATPVGSPFVVPKPAAN